MMAVAMTPNSDIAAIVATAFYAIWNLFAGFIIPRPVSSPSRHCATLNNLVRNVYPEKQLNPPLNPRLRT